MNKYSLGAVCVVGLGSVVGGACVAGWREYMAVPHKVYVGKINNDPYTDVVVEDRTGKRVIFLGQEGTEECQSLDEVLAKIRKESEEQNLKTRKESEEKAKKMEKELREKAEQLAAQQASAQKK